MAFEFKTKKVETPSENPKITTEKKVSKSILGESCTSFLNFRILEEEKSSRIYLAMSLWLEDKGYFNSAKLWHKYSQEELIHAGWARDFLLSYNIRPLTQPLPETPNEYSGLPDIIYKTLEHEIMITNQCAELLQHALTDVLLLPLAQRYVSEQAEEMRRSYDVVNLLDTFGSDKLALALLDQALSKYL